MKITVHALVVRKNDEIVKITPIKSPDDYMAVTFPFADISQNTLDTLINSIFSGASERTKLYVADCIIRRKDLIINTEAWHIPSIPPFFVGVETREFEWE